MADANKLKSFLDQNKLNTNRVLAVSHKLETLTREDRRIKLTKRQVKAGEAKTGTAGEKKELAKPRSGRPVTSLALQKALSGGEVSGPTKQRILRAVNYLLEQKKKEKIDLRALF